MGPPFALQDTTNPLTYSESIQGILVAAIVAVSKVDPVTPGNSWSAPLGCGKRDQNLHSYPVFNLGFLNVLS